MSDFVVSAYDVYYLSVGPHTRFHHTTEFENNHHTEWTKSKKFM